eukprot:TRINITY_DN3557_c0_g1_i1.p1 TRINITY_DN3557_c0_g1~~TRINITY_DN3557_c0_g1_i1.p1  ORF type:complete len:1010 (+),score=100.70 TRINITY_DN3557_c0_g1_i1:59-3031(+)
MRFVVSIVCIVVHCSIAAVQFEIPFDVSSYTHHIETTGDQAGSGAVAYWRTDGSKIFMGLAGTGWWTGFGMNDRPTMQGADIVMCHGQSNNADLIDAVDYYASRNGKPAVDAVQDWVVQKSGRSVYKIPDPPANACATGYHWWRNRCYKVGRKKNYEQAKAVCESEGGTLASIDDAEENVFVANLAAGRLSGGTPVKRPFAWLGTSRDKSSSSNWKAPDGSAAKYTNFWKGSTNGQYDNCALLGVTEKSVDEDPQTLWFSIDCRWAEPGYVCEKATEPGVQNVDWQKYKPKLPVTWCEIRRTLKTCDPVEDWQIRELNVGLRGLLAWSDTAYSNDIQYHGAGNRRHMVMSFDGSVSEDTSAKPVTGLPSDAVTVEFAVPPTTVSASSGSFAYSYHKFDIDSSKQFHIVAWAVIWDRNSPAVKAGLNHHLDLKRCKEPIPGATLGGSVSKGLVMAHCGDLFLAASRTLPSDEGIPIGKDSVVYVAIEQHYYNPAGKVGVSNTGAKFKVVYTPTLRPKVMSQIHIGNPQLVIPKETFGFVMRSHCPPGCTTRMGAIKTNRVAFHAHGHTRAAWLRHVRNGEELEPLAHIEPYDDSVGVKSIDREILPGDELLLDCVYDNDLTKDIVYGDGIDDEMCWATLSVVGANTVTQCYDFPRQAKWPSYDKDCGTCVANNFKWAGCKPCDLSIPRTHCPRPSDVNGDKSVFDSLDRRGDPNSALINGLIDNDALILKYKPFPLTAGGCSIDNGYREEIVPGTAGKCPSDGSLITGQQDCVLKWGGSVSISWQTDCKAKEVTFTLESWGNAGWMALGLHDAGSADNIRKIPPTRMNRADIVQVNVFTNLLKDAIGEDYKTPRPKASTIATLVSAEVKRGRRKAVFKRPFASLEGLPLREDAFVWLVCASRTSSHDLDAKHNVAASVDRTPISLFGGVPGSRRWSVTDRAAPEGAAANAAGDLISSSYEGVASATQVRRAAAKALSLALGVLAACALLIA